jgi:hypothetical protein
VPDAPAYDATTPGGHGHHAGAYGVMALDRHEATQKFIVNQGRSAEPTFSEELAGK